MSRLDVCTSSGRSSQTLASRVHSAKFTRAVPVVLRCENMSSFHILPSPSASGATVRLGRLITGSGHVFDTPAFIAPSSRGAVPHLSPDSLRNCTKIKGVYAAFEDCIVPPPVSPARVEADKDTGIPLSCGETTWEAAHFHHPRDPAPIYCPSFLSIHHPCSPPGTADQLSSLKYR